MSVLRIDIREWEQLQPEKGSPLFHRYIEDEAARYTIKELNEKGIVNILELKDGLQITSNSYVGKIKIGDIELNIYPKIEGMPLYKLLKYAYRLRDLKIFDEAVHAIASSRLYDLLIYQLYAEIEELLYRGFNKMYKKLDADLETPRGRIDIKKIAAKANITGASLPCKYFERNEDNDLNRALLAGLYLALELAEDPGLKIHLHRLCSRMEQSINPIELNRHVLIRTLKSIDRLSEHYRSALELINILYESHGIQLEDGSMYMKLKGFFFDMNVFFQALLSKLMKEHLEGFTVRDEYTLHELLAYTPGFNPQRRYAPKPRPDFAVMKGSRVVCLLDAKYRDLWERNLPREMLYQLSIYAVSGVGSSTAKILYPSMSPEAKLQKLDIKNPATGTKYAEVILQPVSLPLVAELLNLSSKVEIKDYVKQIVFGG
jgi:5-methylcytosine-specific restriction enzyme subunit McrC